MARCAGDTRVLAIQRVARSAMIEALDSECGCHMAAVTAHIAKLPGMRIITIVAIRTGRPSRTGVIEERILEIRGAMTLAAVARAKRAFVWVTLLVTRSAGVAAQNERVLGCGPAMACLTVHYCVRARERKGHEFVVARQIVSGRRPILFRMTAGT